jgi:hypothetical protein
MTSKDPLKPSRGDIFAIWACKFPHRLRVFLYIFRSMAVASHGGFVICSR